MKKDFNISDSMIPISSESTHYSLAPYQKEIKELQENVQKNVESKGIIVNNSKGSLFSNLKYILLDYICKEKHPFMPLKFQY